MMVLNQQVAKTQLRKGIYYYFLPTYKQAKQVAWDELVKNHIPLEIVDKVNESELAVYYKNGSIQRFLGCEDINKHRGANPIDVVFDEFSEMNPKIWTEIIQPVLRENGGTASFIFTPKGRNHAWELLQKAKDNSDWYQDIKGVYDTNGLSEEEIAKAKKETPESIFKQEYLCEFLDGAGQFFRRIRENVTSRTFEPDERCIYQMGVDLAKYEDWTVITVFNQSTFQVEHIERFNQVDWNLQKARIEAVCRRYFNARVVIDSTGVGDPIVEDLERQGLPIEPFRFTSTSRDQLLHNLAVLLEQDKIKLVSDDNMVRELEAMRYVLTSQGRLKLGVPDNMHDDCVMSLALAVWGMREKEPYHYRETEEIKIYSPVYG